MKTIFSHSKAIFMIACFMILSAGIATAAAGWTLPRIAAVGFSIGNKGYIGTGAALFKTQQIELADFWEYNPATDSWTQKADFGGGIRGHAVGFSIGTKGYIGTGQKGTVCYKDFWEYDPAANRWTKKADFGGVGRKAAVGISINGKGYIGTGGVIGNPFECRKDFWEYDPVTDKWVQIADLPGSARFIATGFSIGGKGYVGTGAFYVSSTNSLFLNDVYEYDPSARAWTQKADFAGMPRTGASGFSIGTKGYVGTGFHGNGYLKDFWEYNSGDDSWTPVADFAGGERSTPPGFSIGTKGYIGTGWNANHEYQKDFWEFNPAANAWTRKADLGTTRKLPGKSVDAIPVQNQAGSPELCVFPNPSNSIFNFRLETTCEKPVTIQIYDLSGKLVQKHNTLSPGNTLSIGGNLKTGTYMAVVRQGEFSKIVRIVKAR